MAERYTRVFTAKNNLYTLGSPVILSAGALLKDNKTGNVFAQLKIKNISSKKIKAMFLNVSAFDVSGEALGKDVFFEYLDLNVSRDEEFGQKTLIPLPIASTRVFDVTVTKVIFEDNDIWKNDQKFTLTVPEPTSLASLLQDDELLEQYAMHFNQTVAMPEKVLDLWYCACGALNHQEETECPKCGNKLESLLACDFDALKSERDERLAKEKAEREAKAAEETAAREAKRIARAKAAKKTKRVLSIVIPTICAIIAIVLVITKMIIPNNKYNVAVALMDEGKYEEAITAFEAMNGYKDSVEQITACETGIKDEAYDAAVALMADGNVVEAYESLIAMDGYKDSAEKAEGIRLEYETEKMKYAEVGDYITFGTYEQDNDISNGKENIEWLVLEKEDNKVFVISRYALDCKQYNAKRADVTWKTCALRTWLNGTFLTEAFSEADQAIIQTTKVSADKNPDYDTNPGSATEDRIFLLSINEAHKYFPSDEARMCVPTAYAIANGAYLSDRYKVDGAATCWWWLRSPGYWDNYAAFVSGDGDVGSFGYYVVSNLDCVRPAMWISLDT